jgi:hypothetical protein
MLAGREVATDCWIFGSDGVGQGLAGSGGIGVSGGAAGSPQSYSSSSPAPRRTGCSDASRRGGVSHPARRPRPHLCVESRDGGGDTSGCVPSATNGGTGNGGGLGFQAAGGPV